MMDKFQRALYGNHWLIMHTLLTVVLCIIIVGIFFILRIDINELKRLINNDTVSISAELAGFVFAGMSIFISLEGNKKIQTINFISDLDNILKKKKNEELKKENYLKQLELEINHEKEKNKKLMEAKHIRKKAKQNEMIKKMEKESNIKLLNYKKAK